MTTTKQNRYDRFLLGWLVGAIVPVIIFLILFQVKYGKMDFLIYVKNMWNMKIFLKILSLCVFPNLGFFLFFYRQKYDMAARGVILATFMYTFFVLIVKLI